MKHSLSIVSLIVSCAALCLTLVVFYEKKEEKSLFLTKLENHIKACLDYNKEITQKEEIFSLLEQVAAKNTFVQTGTDDLRIKFVNFQSCIEHVLACSQVMGEITSLIGAIHTPMIATPLCVKPDNPISDDIMDPSIRYNIDKLLTVQSRAQVVRQYLTKGGKLYIVYPKGGFEKRTPEQQNIYLEELAKFPNNLFDWVLSCSEMDPNMIGATYFFRNQQREVFVFSLKGRQINEIQKQAEWGVWLGPVNDAVIVKRVNEIFDYLVSCDGPDLREMF